MAGIIANNVKHPATADALALGADLLDGSSDSHGIDNDMPIADIRECITGRLSELQTFDNTELSPVWVVLKDHAVTHEYLDSVQTHPTGKESEHSAAVLKKDTEHCVRKRLGNSAARFPFGKRASGDLLFCLAHKRVRAY